MAAPQLSQLLGLVLAARLAPASLGTDKGVVNSEIKSKGHSQAVAVWRAEVNTRIHVRIQLQSKYVEYVLRM